MQTNPRTKNRSVCVNIYFAKNLYIVHKYLGPKRSAGIQIGFRLEGAVIATVCLTYSDQPLEGSNLNLVGGL